MVNASRILMQNLAKNFRVSGVHCGIKKNGNFDLAVIASDIPCTTAGVFTKNKFRAAPVLVCETILDKNEKDGGKQFNSVVINSGCANACTGEEGLENAKFMSQRCGSTLFKHDSNGALVMSTGVIGQHLNRDIIEKGIEEGIKKLSNTSDAWNDCAKAIMTTDTYHKTTSKSFNLPGITNEITITGIAKGVGMIHPNMATMLCVLVTDASVNSQLLQKSLKHSADRSFNCISVDGDTSTNDSVVILANGSAMESDIKEDSPAYEEFQKALTETSIDLAQMLVRDGEGATKFVSIHVDGAKTVEDGRKIASTVATSSLVKTAIFGQDANWGRIICALGYSEADFEPSKVNLYMGATIDGKEVDRLHLFKNGAPNEIDEDRAAKILKNTDIFIHLNVDESNSTAERVVYWTSDLSYEYIKINADYRS